MAERDPDILVDLTTARTDFEAEVIVQALQAQGIPARAFTTAGAMLQWEVAMTQPMRIAVRRADLARARDALRALQAESVDLDWDEVDTGEAEPDHSPPAAEPPPRTFAGSNDAPARSSASILLWLLGAVLAMLLIFWVADQVERRLSRTQSSYTSP